MKKNILSVSFAIFMMMAVSSGLQAFAPPIPPPCNTEDPEMFNIGVAFTYVKDVLVIRDSKPFSCVSVPEGCEVNFSVGLKYNYTDFATGESGVINNRMDRIYTYDASEGIYNFTTQNLFSADNVVETTYMGDDVIVFLTVPAPGLESAYTSIEAQVAVFAECNPSPEFHCVEIDILSARFQKPFMLTVHPPINECLEDLGVAEFGYVSEFFTVWEP